MLNSFLSHLLFGSTTQQNDDQINNSSNTNSFNNSNLNNVNNVNINNKSAIDADHAMKFNFIDDYRHDIDWVIVDPYDSETKKLCDKKRKLNLTRSLTMSEYGLSNLFDEEQIVPQTRQSSKAVESEGRAATVQQLATQATKTKEDNWCITPLPSLVTISNEQRSLIESGPYENLLIENPTMSVFISATSSSNDDSKDENKIDFDDENDDKVIVGCAFENASEKLMTKKRNKRQRKQKNKSKKSNNKENGGIEINRSRQNSTSSTASSTSSTTTAAANANNTQQNVASSSTSTASRFLCNTTILLNANKQHINKLTATNKKQMKRNNKLQMKNANVKQRKYHNLQQPQYSVISFAH